MIVNTIQSMWLLHGKSRRYSMKSTDSRKAVLSAVTIIENLIEVTVKNEEDEMTEQLREAKELLLSSLGGSSFDVFTYENALACIKFIIEVLSNNS